MDPLFNNLQEAWNKLEEKESKEPSLAYMLYVDPSFADKLVRIQKDLGLEGDLTPKSEFHVTVRYAKTKKDPQEIVDFLDSFRNLPIINVKTKKFELLGPNKEALVLKLESDEIHDWFHVCNEVIVSKGFPESDYPDYTPHITLTYQEDIKLPKWDEKYELDIPLNVHIITTSSNSGDEYETIWKKKV